MSFPSDFPSSQPLPSLFFSGPPAHSEAPPPTVAAEVPFVPGEVGEALDGWIGLNDRSGYLLFTTVLVSKSLSEWNMAEGANSHIHPHFQVEKLKFATLSRAKCEEVSEDVSK